MQRKRTLNAALPLVLAIGTIGIGLAHSAPVAGQDNADKKAKIENAMSAAPSSVSDEATILDNELDDAGKFVVLREGSNGWFCFPDLPGTPGNDPQCMDQTWLDWNYAFYAGEEPNVTAVGLEYMLQGGSEASNTDPFATEPAAGEAWMTAPPHVMIIMPGDIDQSVFSPDYHSGAPWIMYAGTPYEHIMMSMTEGVMDEMGAMAEATPSA
jgi:hypothetical protein